MIIQSYDMQIFITYKKGYNSFYEQYKNTFFNQWRDFITFIKSIATKKILWTLLD